jgi:cellulose synthase/poly-beta-1,6-N-acetylglucosamine synthase-like glycosyltransferase
MLALINILMWIFGAVLCILFIFLAFTGTIIVISLFKKPLRHSYRPKFSIVVPAYNESKNIASCLKSIMRSRYPKDLFEVIVVDDGSTDDTVKIARSFRGVKVLKINHKGKSAALNHGIKNAMNELVMTVDSDTMLHPDALAKMVAPFKDERIGATSGTYKVDNHKNMLTSFQSIEYAYNSLIRMAFSRVYADSVWFYGAMSCYRVRALKSVGNMHSDVLAEDMDIAIRLQNKGYNVVHVHDAFSYTVVPETFASFFRQRIRWWTGVLQSMRKNRKASYKNMRTSHPVPLIFVYVSQWWWSVFSILSFPMFTIQIIYWLPQNAPFFEVFMYIFRWFSLFGPLYVIYKIPDWGISFFSIFGILSGIISVTFIIMSMNIFKEDIRLREVLAIIFYFPYTLLLNMVMMISVFKYLLYDSRGFVK